MKTTDLGLKAETVVADLLVKQGFEILDQNWKTARCEVDVIAQKDHVVYFVEVKYRAGMEQGDGFEYITDRKQRQMRFAAEIWNQQHDWGGDWRLMAAAVSGLDCESIEIIEID